MRRCWLPAEAPISLSGSDAGPGTPETRKPGSPATDSGTRSSSRSGIGSSRCSLRIIPIGHWPSAIGHDAAKLPATHPLTHPPVSIARALFAFPPRETRAEDRVWAWAWAWAGAGAWVWVDRGALGFTSEAFGTRNRPGVLGGSKARLGPSRLLLLLSASASAFCFCVCPGIGWWAPGCWPIHDFVGEARR